MDPTLLAGAALVGGLAKGVGNFFQAKTQQGIADFNRQVAEQNAEVVRENAEITSGLIARQDRFKQARLRAAFAGRGVRVDEGSPMKVLLEQIKIDEFNRARFEFNERLRARGFDIQAIGQQVQQDSIQPFSQLFSGIGQGVFTAATILNPGGSS